MYTQQKATIQKLLDENSQLILSAIDLLANGKHSECLEHQRTLHRNLMYLIQCDPTVFHHGNTLPPPEVFLQTSSVLINGQSDQIYQTQSNILNQPVQNVNLYSTNKSTLPQQRSSYPIQQNTYGQYQIPHSQQTHSRISTQSPHFSSYPQQT